MPFSIEKLLSFISRTHFKVHFSEWSYGRHVRAHCPTRAFHIFFILDELLKFFKVFQLLSSLCLFWSSIQEKGYTFFTKARFYSSLERVVNYITEELFSPLTFKCTLSIEDIRSFKSVEYIKEILFVEKLFGRPNSFFILQKSSIKVFYL